jgi:hypothetical protein
MKQGATDSDRSQDFKRKNDFLDVVWISHNKSGRFGKALSDHVENNQSRKEVDRKPEWTLILKIAPASFEYV